MAVISQAKKKKKPMAALFGKFITHNCIFLSPSFFSLFIIISLIAYSAFVVFSVIKTYTHDEAPNAR